MKKKILSFLLAVLLLPVMNIQAAYIADDIDYTEELSTIRTLMAECDEKGISYDYEMVNYKTIEKFVDFIKTDIEDGIDDEIVSFNLSKMDELCQKTISNLQGYLNGEKTPKAVSLPDMSKVAVSGNGLTDGKSPIFSVGYGHSNSVINDIQNFNSFGTDNIQIEVGPTELIDYIIPFEAENHSTDYTLQLDAGIARSGKFSLKTEVKTPKNSGVYVRFNQTVYCKPNTTYNFGTYAKCTDKSTNGLGIILRGNDWNAPVTITPTDDWQLFSGSFTTSETQTTMNFNFLIEGEAVCYFDDMYVYENGYSDNLLVNGDFEGTKTSVPFGIAKNGNVDACAMESSKEVYSGATSMKVVNNTAASSNVYMLLSQKVPCEPETVYEFGTFAKYTDNSTNGLNINIFGNGWDWSSLVSVNTPGEWKEYKKSFTTAENQTSFEYMILVEGETECYFDDMFVRKEGTSENLLLNGDMEKGSAYSNIIETLQGLKKAEMYNVGVSLLLSPHYFPTNISDVEYNPNANGFIGYNINSPAAKIIIEKHLRTILPIAKDYTCINNICISNEPEFRTSNYPDFYNPLFREWLGDIHLSVDGVNAAYNLSDGVLGFGKTSYDSMDEIVMPDPENFTSASKVNALFYDWIEYNDEVLANWHKWMSGIIKEYTSKPLHSKIMNTFRWSTEDNTREQLTRGTDFEMFDEFTDMAGNDAANYIDDLYSYWYSMMLYDYLSSVTDKPVYNSETHIIRDGNSSVTTSYDASAEANATNHIWMGASRGVSMYSIWLWGRSNDATSQASQSILTRPDVVAGVGHTSLDMTRLSNKIDDIVKSEHKVAIFYSKPSRVHNNEHTLYNFRVYQALVNAGIKVGFVSEKSLDKLSEYDALILANVTNGTPESVDAINNYMANGGKVLSFGNAMTKNQYNVSQNSSISSHSNCSTSSSTPNSTGAEFSLSDGIVADVYDFITNNNLSRVTLKDTNGNIPVGLDWTYSISEERLLVNITNLDYGSTKNINVYLDGERITGMTELISGTENVSTAAVAGFEPQLLELILLEPSEIINITDDNSTQEITWDYTDGIYNGANIYLLSKSGDFELIATVTDGTSYAYTQSGTYAVKSVDDESEITDLDTISVVSNSSFTLSVSNVKKSGNSVSGAVSTVNNESNAMQGVIKFEVLDSENNIINYHYQTVTIKSGSSDSFKISLPVTDSAAKVKVSAIDSKVTNNIISNTIDENL